MANAEQLLKDLRIRRGALQAQQTKLKSLINTKGEELTRFDLEARLERLESYMLKFDEIQDQLEVLEEEGSDEKRENFEESHCSLKAKIKELIDKKSSVVLKSISNDVKTNESSSNTNKIKSAHLPSLSLPKFSGKFSDWSEFFAIFETIIHNDSELTNVEKFTHLRSCLSGQALLAIENLSLSHENYNQAIESLKNRFENKRLAVQDHIKDIVNLKVVDSGSANQLRLLSDQVNAHLRSIKGLISDAELLDSLLIYVVSRKCDRQTQAKWEEQMIDGNIPNYEQFAEFLSKRCRILENVEHNKVVNIKQENSKQKGKSSSFCISKSSINCEFCKADKHFLYACDSFLKLTPQNRFLSVKKLNLCINCLKPNHTSKDCKSSKCRECKQRHHTLLHFPKGQASQEENVTKPTDGGHSTNSSFSIAHAENSEKSNEICTFLATALVDAKSSEGNFITCRALLDSASQLHFISENFVQLLHLKKTKTEASVSGIGLTSAKIKYKVNLNFKSKFEDFSQSIEAFVLPNINNIQTNCKINLHSWNLPEGIHLADPYFYNSCKVNILIGAGLFFELLAAERLYLGKNFPILQKTKLGWVVSGTLTSQTSRASCYSIIENKQCVDCQDTNKLVEKFWQVEEMPVKSRNLSSEELACENHFLNNFTRGIDGRFSVRLPFKDNVPELGDSFETAKRRLINLERKLCKSPDIQWQYNNFMREYLAHHHMEKVEFKDLPPRHNFLPHHHVLKPESSSTRLRVVFDASSKTTSGYSLNDVLMIGPTIQDDLFAILLKFRSFKYALTADITKMYRQVRVEDPDSYFQCILWRDSICKDIEIYKLTTVTYGTAPAAFLATRCLKQLAVEEGHKFPLGSEVLQNNFYVDDMLAGADDLPSVKRLKVEIEQLLNLGGFTLSKWCASHDDILAGVEDAYKEKYLKIENDEVIKTLGMIWQPKLDVFKFHHNRQDSLFNNCTKRSILSNIAKFFDPLGLLSPVITKAKVILQKLWASGLDWDEQVSQQLQQEWQNLIDQLNVVGETRIPRFVLDRSSLIELHGFADASIQAYGACVYARCIFPNGEIRTHLLASKSRVAPLKSMTIPRLELSAALILSELIHRINDIFESYVSRVYCWSDSSIVLCWINSSPSRWGVFVSHRVAKIQELTTSFIWKHVPTNCNPADLITRGASPSQLLSSSLWFNGPYFLASNNDWPEIFVADLEDPPEQRKTVKAFNVTRICDIVKSSKFCNYYLKAVNVFAYMARFISNSKLVGEKNQLRKSGLLSTEELEKGLMMIIYIIQRAEFADEFKALSKDKKVHASSKLKALNPFIDDNGLLRVGGRLKHSEIPYEAKHQVLLPKSHPFTKALIVHFHVKNLHAAAQTLLVIIRSRFWPLGGLVTVKGAIFNCIRCFRTQPRTIQQLMGELPPPRVKPSRPFTHTGVDFCGPFFVTNLIRGRSPRKVYVCVFICFSVKAVHLEIVSDLSTNAFIAGLRRFISRRGCCSALYSDNATNFVGASSQLKEFRDLFLSQHNIEGLQNECKIHGIKWKFIPPRSPHFGGLWESSVKIAKYYIKRTAVSGSYTYEEFETLICQVEAMINSRPITPVSNDPHDLEALTPGHFLIGSPLVSFPEPNLKDVKMNRLDRWQRVQAMAQHFWQRWHREYLQVLQTRYKWINSRPNVEVGMLVLVADMNAPPLKWPLGRIIEVHKGEDGYVRVVTIKLQNCIVKRAITKICPLPTSE